MAGEGPGSPVLSTSEDTAGENIPKVDADPGACAPDRSVSAPRGVASRGVVAAASDFVMLVTTRNSMRFASFRVFDVDARKVAPPPMRDDAVPNPEPPLPSYVWR